MSRLTIPSFVLDMLCIGFVEEFPGLASQGIWVCCFELVLRYIPCWCFQVCFIFIPRIIWKMFTDFQTPMFCLRHTQNKTKATQREIQTNHSFWKEEKARKNPWMSKFPRQSHYSYDSLHHVTATYFEPKDDGVQDEFSLGVMAVSAFFSGMRTFGSPP